MKRFMIAGLVFMFALACTGPSTVITATWEKPGIEQQYNDILVAALVSTVSSRSVIEQNIVEELRNEGVNARQSVDVLPPRFIENEDKKRDILDVIQKNGSDAILTITLIEKDTESRYVPGSGAYAPYPYYSYYGSFWGYYNHWYPQFYDTGYYNDYKVFYFETNLYDSNTQDLVWSAQSETVEYDGALDFTGGFSSEIVDKLADHNMIP